MQDGGPVAAVDALSPAKGLRFLAFWQIATNGLDDEPHGRSVPGRAAGRPCDAG